MLTVTLIHPHGLTAPCTPQPNHLAITFSAALTAMVSSGIHTGRTKFQQSSPFSSLVYFLFAFALTPVPTSLIKVIDSALFIVGYFTHSLYDSQNIKIYDTQDDLKQKLQGSDLRMIRDT